MSIHTEKQIHTVDLHKIMLEGHTTELNILKL